MKYKVINYQRKYEFLLTKLQVSDIDLWEKGALIEMPRTIYFQFGDRIPESVDEAVEMALGIYKEDV